MGCCVLVVVVVLVMWLKVARFSNIFFCKRTKVVFQEDETGKKQSKKTIVPDFFPPVNFPKHKVWKYVLVFLLFVGKKRKIWENGYSIRAAFSYKN